MFLPYINYDVPVSLCVLGLDENTEVLPLDSADGVDFVSLGQRSLAEFPFYAVYDRTEGSVTIELGATTSTDGKGTLGVQIAISIIIVIILFAMLVYLIFLRRKRIKAEEWLE